MKFHEIHIGQRFLSNRITKGMEFEKTGHSTAFAVGYSTNDFHFAATDEVDGLQPSNKHPQPTPKYPIPASDHLGGMMILGDAIGHLSQDARRNFHESPFKRHLYQNSTDHALSYLRQSFDTLKKEHGDAAIITP